MSALPNSPGTAVVEETETRHAPRYRVFIHDDPVTDMAFVVHALMRFFRKTVPEAQTIMLEAHNGGVALVAVLPLEQAEFRVEQAHALARSFRFPLTFTYEPE